AVLTFAAYVLIMPVVSWARQQVMLEHLNKDQASLTEQAGLEEASYAQASLGERFAIIQRGVDLWSRGSLDLERKGGWWHRLCYASSQALAMDLYDRGRPGDSFGLVVYGWVPRFLWRDKPVITPGADFSEIALGHRGTHTGIGV